MRWPWPRRKDRKADQAHADAALVESQRRRVEASERAEGARRKEAWWQRVHAENHFIEPFRETFREGQ